LLLTEHFPIAGGRGGVETGADIVKRRLVSTRLR